VVGGGRASGGPDLGPAAGVTPRTVVGHPIATAEIPKVGSVEDRRALVRGKMPWPSTCPPREEAARCQSRAMHGYWCTGVPPNASGIVMAIGQLPTDSFDAGPVNQNRPGFGCPYRLPPGQPTRRPGGGRDRTGTVVCLGRDSAAAAVSRRPRTV